LNGDQRALCIGNSGKEEKIFTDCIVPDDGVAGLIFETGEDGGVAIIVNTAFSVCQDLT